MLLSEYLINIKTGFRKFLCMFEAMTREYFQGVCDYFLEPAKEVPVMVQLVFGKELLTVYSLSKARSEPKSWFSASLRLTKNFGNRQKSPKEV